MAATYTTPAATTTTAAVPLTLPELEAHISIASETLAENTRLIGGIQAQLKGLITAEVGRIGAIAELRSSLQSLSHALQTDPRQHWRPARKNVEALHALQQQLQEVSQAYVREFEEKVFTPLRLIVEEELKVGTFSSHPHSSPYWS